MVGVSKVEKSRGVSPIIGTILLIVITVVITAVVGTFVFGLGQSVKPAPKAQFILEDAGDMLNDNSATDAILLIRHVGGDPINCKDIQFIIKDLTNGRTWVLEYDGQNFTGYFYDRVPPQNRYAATIPNWMRWGYNTKVNTFIDLRTYKAMGGSRDTPVTIPSPVILAFGQDQNYQYLVNNSNQFGDPNYGVKNGGILSVGDTIVLIEANVTLYGVNGGPDDPADPNDDYYGTRNNGDFASSWLGNLFYQQYGRNLGMWFGDVFNRSNTPADIEVTIVHVPTNAIIYQGIVKVQ